mmetsp:Transcript_23980/g.66665  ORF Transcript_23980/g.66665 Transcript_23980/m.66665 type:complete len:275 (+) Transcript_23980:636-1460(+)
MRSELERNGEFLPRFVVPKRRSRCPAPAAGPGRGEHRRCGDALDAFLPSERHRREAAHRRHADGCTARHACRIGGDAVRDDLRFGDLRGAGERPGVGYAPHRRRVLPSFAAVVGRAGPDCDHCGFAGLFASFLTRGVPRLILEFVRGFRATRCCWHSNILEKVFGVIRADRRHGGAQCGQQIHRHRALKHLDPDVERRCHAHCRRPRFLPRHVQTGARREPCEGGLCDCRRHRPLRLRLVCFEPGHMDGGCHVALKVSNRCEAIALPSCADSMS